MKGTPLYTSLIGRLVYDLDGTRLGRVTAVIHRRDSTDVLVERRRWLRRSVHRYNLWDLELEGAGLLLVRTDAGRAAPVGASSRDQRR